MTTRTTALRATVALLLLMAGGIGWNRAARADQGQPAASGQAAADNTAGGQQGASDSDSSGDFSVTTGFDLTEGKYGAHRLTRILTIPTTLAYDTENYTFSVLVPYIRQSGPSGSFLLGGRPILLKRGLTGAQTTASGLGDVVTSVTRYLVQNPDSGLMLDVEGGIEWGTADPKKGLGTGKDDYYAQGDVSQGFGRFIASGTLGYMVVGQPAHYQLNNVAYASVDGSWKFTHTVQAGVTLDGQQAPEPGGYPQGDVTVHLDVDIGQSASLDAYVVKGVANGSPDRGGGATVTVYF